MTAEAKKTMMVGALDFIDTLMVALENELQQDPTTPRKAKILRSAKKLHQLYAAELDKQQGKELLLTASRREGAMDLIEVLLLMGFDNASLTSLLFTAQNTHLLTLLIKKYGLRPYLFNEAQEFGFNLKLYLQYPRVTSVYYYVNRHSKIIHILDLFLTAQHTQYIEYLAPFFQDFFMEAFNGYFPVSHEKRLAIIISDYAGFGFDLSRSKSILKKQIAACEDEYSKILKDGSIKLAIEASEAQLAKIELLIKEDDQLRRDANQSALKERSVMEEHIQRRNKLFKPLIDYCNSHFLDFEARQVLNSLLDEKRLFSRDIERDLDILLDNHVHWSKSYYCFLLLARLNVQQVTHNAIANERKEHMIRDLSAFTNSRKIQYRQECKSYYTLHQRYGALLEDYLKLKNNFNIQDDTFILMGGISLLLLLIQIIGVLALPFLSLAGIAVYFAGLGCTLSLFIGQLLIAAHAPHINSGYFRFENISLFSCPNVDVTIKNSMPGEDNQLQLDQLKVKYESIQAASAGLKNAWRRLQDNEQYYRPYARKEFASVQIQYNKQFKFLLGLACFNPVALTLGIVGICLSNPWIFIGLTTGAAVSTLSSAYGLFKRAQYSLSNSAAAIEANGELVPITEMALGN